MVCQMSEQLSNFTEFYKKKHANRVLNWDHSLGNASVIGHFKGSKKELLVSLYQAIILLQFNENVGGIRYNEIKAATRMREFRSGSLSLFRRLLTCSRCAMVIL
jgi:cullin-4